MIRLVFGCTFRVRHWAHNYFYTLSTIQTVGCHATMVTETNFSLCISAQYLKSQPVADDMVYESSYIIFIQNGIDDF